MFAGYLCRGDKRGSCFVTWACTFFYCRWGRYTLLCCMHVCYLCMWMLWTIDCWVLVTGFITVFFLMQSIVMLVRIILICWVAVVIQYSHWYVFSGHTKCSEERKVNGLSSCTSSFFVQVLVFTSILIYYLVTVVFVSQKIKLGRNVLGNVTSFIFSQS